MKYNRCWKAFIPRDLKTCFNHDFNLHIDPLFSSFSHGCGKKNYKKVPHLASILGSLIILEIEVM